MMSVDFLAVRRAARPLVFAVALLGCGAAGAATSDPNAVVATVNGTTITERDVAVAAEELGQSFAGMPEDQKRDTLINLLIDIRLVSQAAEKQKLDTTEDFKKQLAFLREKALMQSFLDKTGKSAVSDAAVKKLYDDTVKELTPEDEIKAAHILVPTEEEAKAVEARLKAGEDFAKVAKEVSKDTGSAAEGGELGYFTKDQMVPEFSEAAAKLKPGEVSAPVKSQFGWHVIKVEDKRKKPLPTLEQVKDQIETYLTRKAQQEQIKKLRDEGKIERTAAAKPPAGATTPAPGGETPAAAAKPAQTPPAAAPTTAPAK
jgi:peptidyl-prolyl cis-trans isomerase C